VPAVEAIGDDPQELRRSLRELVAVSMLPAVWREYDTHQIAQSVTEVLIRMLGLELALMLIRWRRDDAIFVARSSDRGVADPTAAIRDALGQWLDRFPPSEAVTLDHPLRPGVVRVAFVPVAAGDHALIAAASAAPEFPSPTQRLLLEVAANQAAIAIRRWQAEHALQRLNETLEERVATEIRERIKVEEAFRQAQKMEAVGQLTGGIAHDFNNLLAAVLGNLKLLHKRLKNDAAALRLIGGAIEGAERGAALTQRLLAFARQQDLHPAPADVPELVLGMLEMLQRSIGPLIQIETEFAADLWPAHVDANQLELALLNLVVNARDAMPEGGRLTLRAHNATVAAAADDALDAGDYVCLAVVDAGAGMDEATLAHAAEPFFTTKGTGKGTGLGLSMVHGLAAQSGGALRLSSRPGAGTSAELWLPRAQAAPACAAAAPRRRKAPQALRACTVLLVDDDALISMATGEMLKDLGHRVVEAHSGSKALDILRSGTPVDLVVSDEAMPNMRGTQLAAEIRAAWPDLPIILATGYAELPKGSGLRLPLLRKPYSQQDLAAAIASAIGAQAATAT
jgi:signal transduction histidine kinase/ActR/RegA family two-component response regulator